MKTLNSNTKFVTNGLKAGKVTIKSVDYLCVKTCGGIPCVYPKWLHTITDTPQGWGIFKEE